MRILIINPNSDEGMTEAIQASAERFAKGDFEVVTLPTPEAPRFIETYEDEIRCGPGMLRIIRENEADYDAFIIACHSDSNIHGDRFRCNSTTAAYIRQTFSGGSPSSSRPTSKTSRSPWDECPSSRSPNKGQSRHARAASAGSIRK